MMSWKKKNLVRSIPETASPHSNKKKRNLFISLLAAASVLLGIIYFVGFDSGSDYYQAAIVMPDGSSAILTDFVRGALDGWADISFEYTEKGERISVFGNKPGKKKTDHYTLITSAGKEYILKLPDGSRVWMNAESAIVFPANFLQDTIVLKLEGEVFFELAARSPHHYMIMSELEDQGIMIQETGLKRGSVEFQRKGPQLNISAYASDSGLKVTLIGGTVNIANISSHQEIPLQAGQQVILNRGITVLNPSADPAQLTAWKNGDFNFKEVPIQNIMPELERWYNVSVDYQGRIPDKRFTLQVPRTARLSKVLAILEKQGLRVNKKGTKLTITF